MTRSEKSIKNAKYALIGQGFGLLISFLARMVFIHILGKEYLGLNGLFSNILMMLSLAELGVGEAITYSLYKPLAENDEEKSMSLMQLYRKVYTAIGCIIFLIGIFLIPLLPKLINDTNNIDNINLIYILYLINTSISYFFSYKKNLIIADQKRYICTIYKYIFYFIMNVAQIIFLLIKRNIIIYLVIQILFTLFENIAISLNANKLYPYLTKKEKKKLDSETQKEIVKNTKSMMMHKVGGVIVNSTDNIIISKYIGLAVVGIYSNYYLIINALNIIISQFFSSIVASVGNLCVGNDTEKQYNVFKKINFFGFWIHCFSAICLLCLFNPFIELWLGTEYIFKTSIVIILVINYYIYGMRRATLTFKEASGLFYNDRWKSIIEALVNLITSIIFVKKIGVFGVFLGTLISSVVTCVWVEPYVLYKYKFNKKLKNYFTQYFKYLLLTIILGYITYFICSLVEGNVYIAFAIKIFICTIIPNLLLCLIYFKDEKFLYYYNIVKKNIREKLKS